MNERWMHKPRTVNVWEARSAMRWGSKHEGHFKSEEAATALALKKIAAAGSVGRVTHVQRHVGGGVVYFSEHEDET